MAALSQLRTDLLIRFRDVKQGKLTTTAANLYLNIACEDFAKDVEPTWREYGFYITAKQYRYVLPATDYMHTLTMMWYQNGQYEIPYLSPQEFKMRGYMNRRITVSTPQAYTIIDNELYLGPAPGTSGNTTTLNSTIFVGDTTVSLTDSTLFQSHAGFILVDSEQIAYQANANTAPGNLTLCRRAQGGTTQAQHNTGSGLVYRLDLIMTYTYQFVFMVNDSDTPNFNARYHRIPVHYANHLALKMDGRDKQAAEELEAYRSEKLEAKRQVRLLVRDRHNRKMSSGYS